MMIAESALLKALTEATPEEFAQALLEVEKVITEAQLQDIALAIYEASAENLPLALSGLLTFRTYMPGPPQVNIPDEGPIGPGGGLTNG